MKKIIKNLLFLILITLLVLTFLKPLLVKYYLHHRIIEDRPVKKMICNLYGCEYYSKIIYCSETLRTKYPGTYNDVISNKKYTEKCINSIKKYGRPNDIPEGIFFIETQTCECYFKPYGFG